MKTTFVKSGGPRKGPGPFVSLAAIALALGLAGCASTGVATRTISIDSDPQGVRVEANGEDLGMTPTTYTARANRRGDFAGGWGDYPSVVFTAIPPQGADGLYKQTKVFNPSGFMEEGDRVPARIFFDLHLASNR